MMRSILLSLIAATTLMIGITPLGAADAPPASPPATPKPAALQFSVKDIDGKDVDLSQYTGKVVMIVNVASKCGNTPQYAGLEKAYARYKDKGFVILGFPANNFAGQEPGTNAQIKAFCEETYKVDFPMFAKISVKGDDIAPLYQYLTGVDTTPAAKGNITWNFEKFLIGRDGQVVARFTPKTKVEDPKVVDALERALSK